MYTCIYYIWVCRNANPRINLNKFWKKKQGMRPSLSFFSQTTLHFSEILHPRRTIRCCRMTSMLWTNGLKSGSSNPMQINAIGIGKNLHVFNDFRCRTDIRWVHHVKSKQSKSTTPAIVWAPQLTWIWLKKYRCVTKLVDIFGSLRRSAAESQPWFTGEPEGIPQRYTSTYDENIAQPRFLISCAALIKLCVTQHFLKTCWKDEKDKDKS